MSRVTTDTGPSFADLSWRSSKVCLLYTCLNHGSLIDRSPHYHIGAYNRKHDLRERMVEGWRSYNQTAQNTNNVTMILENNADETHKMNEYTNLLSTSIFALAPRGSYVILSFHLNAKKLARVSHYWRRCNLNVGHGLHSYRLLESMGCGCIPVNIGDKYILPFSELVDWNAFSITIPEERVEDIALILQRVAYAASPPSTGTSSSSPTSRPLRRKHLEALQTRSLQVFEERFATIGRQVESVLTILKQRIYDDRYYLLKSGE